MLLTRPPTHTLAENTMGEESKVSTSCFSFFACKDFGSFHYTKAGTLFLATPAGRNPRDRLWFVRAWLGAALAALPACLGGLMGGGAHPLDTSNIFHPLVTQKCQECLDYAFLSAHGEGSCPPPSCPRHYPLSWRKRRDSSTTSNHQAQPS